MEASKLFRHDPIDLVGFVHGPQVLVQGFLSTLNALFQGLLIKRCFFFLLVFFWRHIFRFFQWVSSLASFVNFLCNSPLKLEILSWILDSKSIILGGLSWCVLGVLVLLQLLLLILDDFLFPALLKLLEFLVESLLISLLQKFVIIRHFEELVTIALTEVLLLFGAVEELILTLDET